MWNAIGRRSFDQLKKSSFYHHVGPLGDFGFLGEQKLPPIQKLTVQGRKKRPHPEKKVPLGSQLRILCSHPGNLILKPFNSITSGIDLKSSIYLMKRTLPFTNQGRFSN